ncbi:putative uncharacterized protein [Janthinobacterium agaricidamnosum NBRC 102515 = DSM 9628]|uniref:HTH hxlR-type domain-containing protein n=1 Tax=Janthinobacterium agaricidamnosum NBRC 102515 = DSM 9628 TaxID=1349767 RepID=W0VBQ1_9BURK|nr:putative uncharacterized protein [Janthinobacterium agaricidamnosum NBRC 102515 = DSM 9628]
MQDAGMSTRSRYVMTSKGEELYIVLIALWQWGERNCFEADELQYAMVDRDQQLPLTQLELHAQDGRPLGPRDFRTVTKGC